MPDFNLDQFIRDVFAPDPDETVIVMTDVPHGAVVDDANWIERRGMAEEWHQGFVKLAAETGFTVRPLVEYPATGAHAAPLPPEAQMGGQPIRLEDTLLDSTLVVAFGQFSASAPLSRLADSTTDLRVASLPTIQRRMEATALSADYREVQRRAKILVPLLSASTGAMLSFSTGHQLFLDLRYRNALVDDGYLRRDMPAPRWSNLPAGEAFTPVYEGERPGEPSRTAGTMPVDYGGEQVLCHVEHNQITRVEGSGANATRMRDFFAVDPARANIAELGLGVNPTAVVWGNVLEDEKVGIHVAYGRSDFLGGTVGVTSFKSPQNVVHHDNVFAEGCPIKARTLTLDLPDNETTTIYDEGWIGFA